MRDTLVGDGWRWAIVVLGFTASLIMALLLRLEVKAAKARTALGKKRDRREWGEVTALIGGTTVCFAVGWGTLGVLMGWDSALRLPFTATALAYSVFGRGLQLIQPRNRT